MPETDKIVDPGADGTEEELNQPRERKSPAPPPADPAPRVEPPHPNGTISREQLERDTYNVREKSREPLVNVGE